MYKRQLVDCKSTESKSSIDFLLTDGKQYYIITAKRFFIWNRYDFCLLYTSTITRAPLAIRETRPCAAPSRCWSPSGRKARTRRSGICGWPMAISISTATVSYTHLSHPSRVPLAAFELRRLLFGGAVDLHTERVGRSLPDFLRGL